MTQESHPRPRAGLEDRVARCPGFGHDLELLSLCEGQQASLCARLLDRGAHERVDQSFEYDLARGRLRHLDDRCEVELFDSRANSGHRARRRLIRPEVRIHVLELPHLSVCTPTQVAVSRIPQIEARELFEAPRDIVASGFSRL